MPSSLDTLASNLVDDQLNTVRSFFSNDIEFGLMRKKGVVCTYIEYLLYQEYLNQTHCNTLLQCLHKQRLGEKPKWPKHESIGGVHRKCKCQHSVAHAGRSAKVKYIHIPPRSRLSEHSYIQINLVDGRGLRWSSMAALSRVVFSDEPTRMCGRNNTRYVCGQGWSSSLLSRVVFFDELACRRGGSGRFWERPL